MRAFSLMAFVAVLFPMTVSAFFPTPTLENSSESVTREVKRSINLDALRERLRQRLNRMKSSTEVVPIVRKNTIVRRSKKSVGSVNTVGYAGISFKNLNFSVSIPEGFSVVRDTLMHESGEAFFESGVNSILIKSSGIKCPASGTNLRTCVQQNTKAFADSYVTNDRQLEFLRQRQNNQLLLSVSSSLDPFGSERDQVVEALELQSPSKKLSILGFASPDKEYLWYLVLEGDTNQQTSIGHDHQALYRIFTSLARLESARNIPVRTQVRNSFTSRDRFRSNYRFRANTTDIKAESVFVPKYLEELGLHFDVMQDARLVQDGVDGQYVFRGDDGEVAISVLEEECSGNTSNLLQRCLRENLTDIAETPEGFWLVTEKNILMELDKSVGYKSHIGRYILWQRHGTQRQGILIFRHPWKSTVYRVDFASDAEKSNWTYNDVLLNTFLSSFYFDERE